MIRYLAVIGTLAAFVSAPAVAQQPTAPGQMMHKSVSVSKSGSVSKGASAYAPGHLKKKKLAIRGRPGASGFAPGHAQTSINTRSGMTTGSSVSTRSDVTTGSTAPSRRIESGSQR
jgi:hypothetical protein